MNEIDNNTVAAEDEEISLIDLFSVLIKYRYLIIIGTFLVALYTGLKMFVLPLFNDGPTEHGVTIQYTYQISSLPVALEKELGFENQKIVIKLTNYNMNKLTLLADEIKKYQPFGKLDFEIMSPYEYNAYVRDILQNGTYKANVSPLETEMLVTISVGESNVSIASQMVDDIVAVTNAEIENYIMPKMNAIEKNIDEAMSFATDADAASMTMQNYKNTKVQIQNFKSSYKGFLEKNGEPFIIIEPLGRLKRLTIISFAALFVFILIAFLLNAAQSIKRDPEASGKIKEAWDGGKIARKK